MKKTNKKGFTLIELLAVIAIIAIIGAIATPNVIKLITSSNQEQIISDAKLAISKAKYEFRKDMNDSNNTNEVTYNISELIESDNSYDGQSKVYVVNEGGKYIYKISISNGKYCIGWDAEGNPPADEQNAIDEENIDKSAIKDNCSN
jgi:type IV pilus assembly protein PilA